MKSKKKIVLAGLALLAITMVLLPLAGCKNDSVPPEAHTHTFDWKVETPSTDIAAGKLVKKCTTCSEPGGDEMEIPAGFVYIPAGTFQMGSAAEYPSEKPVHEVTISKGYFMGRHEVTQQLYKAVMGQWGGTEPSSTYGVGDDYPAYYVSWYDAVVFCNKLSERMGLEPVYSKGGKTDTSEWGEVPASSDEGWNKIECNWNARGYRLPTEAEWEYAARAEDATTNARTWSGTKVGDDLGKYAWFNGSNGTSKVGTLLPNAWGLYDMSGNVWEWCWDGYRDYSDESVSDPHGGSSGGRRICRGSGWSSGADYCTVSRRSYSDPNSRSDRHGFRVVRSAN